MQHPLAAGLSLKKCDQQLSICLVHLFGENAMSHIFCTKVSMPPTPQGGWPVRILTPNRVRKLLGAWRGGGVWGAGRARGGGATGGSGGSQGVCMGGGGGTSWVCGPGSLTQPPPLSK